MSTVWIEGMGSGEWWGVCVSLCRGIFLLGCALVANSSRKKVFLLLLLEQAAFQLDSIHRSIDFQCENSKWEKSCAVIGHPTKV